MGVRRAMHGDERENLTLIHLHCFTRCQIIRHDDGRCHMRPVELVLAAQIPDQTIRDILHIRGTRLHIFIIHVCEDLREVVTSDRHRILRIDLLRLDHRVDRVLVVLILEHHLMHLEDLGIHLADLLERLLIKRAELGLCLRLRRLEALELCRDILDVLTLHDIIFLLQNIDRTDRRSLINGLSDVLFHFLSSPVLYRSLNYRFSWKNFSIASNAASSSGPSTCTVTSSPCFTPMLMMAISLPAAAVFPFAARVVALWNFFASFTSSPAGLACSPSSSLITYVNSFISICPFFINKTSCTV